MALPRSVLDSNAYRNLSANARALLLEVALQFHGDDNGRMLLSRKELNKRGWMSSDMIIKGKRELLDNGLIFETVHGRRPHKASWFAMTWQSLDKLPGYDPDAEINFRRGAYREAPLKEKLAVPPHGTERARIVPPHGTGKRPAVPPHGAIRAKKAPAPVPPHGHPLDMPSARASSSCVGAGIGAGIGAEFLNGPTRKKGGASQNGNSEFDLLAAQLRRRTGQGAGKP